MSVEVETVRAKHVPEEAERNAETYATDIPYNWGADRVTRTQSLFGIFYYENLEYCRNITITWKSLPVQTPRYHQISNRPCWARVTPKYITEVANVFLSSSLKRENKIHTIAHHNSCETVSTWNMVVHRCLYGQGLFRGCKCYGNIIGSRSRIVRKGFVSEL